MNTHVSPDELSRENELICEKLLGWKCITPDAMTKTWSDADHDDARLHPTPTFTTWAEAGLILDAMVANGCDWDIESTHTDEGVKATVRVFFPLPNSASVRKCECLGEPFHAIRAAALAYIKAVKS